MEPPRRPVSVVLLVASLLLPRLALANNPNYQGLAILFYAALLILLMMIVFIVLAVLLSLRVKRRAGGQVLIPLTRILAVLWYLTALSPLVYGFAIGGHEHEWNLLFGAIGGLPAHIPSIIALVKASRLASLRSAPASSGGGDARALA